MNHFLSLCSYSHFYAKVPSHYTTAGQQALLDHICPSTVSTASTTHSAVEMGRQQKDVVLKNICVLQQQVADQSPRDSQAGL